MTINLSIKLAMKTASAITIVLSLILVSCLNAKKEIENPSPRLIHIRHIIKSTESIPLPINFNANSWSFPNTYFLDPSGPDSLIFNFLAYSIKGYFPDTTKYFAFLYGVAGDGHYPGIITFKKNGEFISEEIISTGNCITNPRLDVESCFDSVIINKDMTFTSFSELKATVQPYDSVNTVFNASSSKKQKGSIDQNGIIKIEKDYK